MLNKVTFIASILLLHLLIYSGCTSNTIEEKGNNSGPNQATSDYIIAKRDSFPAPPQYKPIIGAPFAAKAVKQFEVSRNYIDGFEPLRFPVEEPEVRTPGKGSYKLPQKVKANPLSGETPFPQQARLKEPISLGINSFSFMTHTKIQGLSHDDILSFCEDPTGNIWIGTYGGGLMRFDGQNIAWFNNTPWGEMPEVISVQADNKGSIWVATTGGLFSINGYQVLYFDSAEGGLLFNSLESLQFDTEGNLWISYWEGGISMYDGQYFYHYGEEQGLSKELGQVLKTDDFGNVWISDFLEGLFLFREGSFYIYKIPFLSNNHRILAIGAGAGNDIWLSMYDIGVVKFDGEEFLYYTLENGFPSPEVYQIEKGAQGQVWFATWGKGLIRWSDNTFEIFGKEQGLFSELINGIYIDRNNVLWIGFKGGMARYKGDIFEHFTTRQAFDTQTTSMALDSNGKLWISSYDGALKSFDGETFTQFTSDPKNPFVFMEGLVADSRGNLWMSVNQAGIFRFDGTHFYHYQLDTLDLPFRIEGGIEDSMGNLWLLIGNQGILKFDGETFTHFTEKNGLPVNLARAVIEDSEGNIVIATYGGGVVIVSEDNFTYYTEKDGLASNYLFSVFQDSENNLWFGTNGKGLSIFNGKDFINFASDKGLTDNYIFSMAQDKDGNMVVGARFGLNVMHYNKLKKTLEQHESSEFSHLRNADYPYFIKHTYEEGFLGIGTNLGMMIEDQGKIWIGTNNRLTRFNSSESFIDSVAPNVIISGIDLFNEQLNWKDLINQQDTSMLLANGVKLKNFSFDKLSPWYYIPENLHLSHKNNFITFHFSGISTASGNQLLYSFKLEGFDQQWHRPVKENHAHYGNLSPGRYTLKVKAMNKLGLWSSEDHYSFVILTPWWKRWWAFALYFITAATILILYIRVREKALVLENKLLDHEVELARKTIEIKQNIIANVSHELRTPLTGIIGLTDILAKTPLNEEQKEYILTLQQTGINLKEIINQILDYSKIESGKISLSNSAFSLKELFLHAEKVFNSLTQNRSELQIRTTISEDVPSVLFADRGRVNQILLNLLYNAVKFTHSGSITLKARVETTSLPTTADETPRMLLKISVTDTGVGISEEAMKKLFVPFSQIENNDTRETDSTGLGLAISKKLAQLLQGDIGVDSKPGKGSHFWFTFMAEQPLENSHETKQNVKPEEVTESKSILLVEDKKVNQLVIKLLLKGMGHRVEIAENGEKALEIFHPDKYDFVLMDIQMPVMDGITATQKLKEKYPKLPPIIGISANAFEGDRKKYMGLGMDEYITKPVSEENLRKVLIQMDMSVSNADSFAYMTEKKSL
ncbi:MAG: response regulator [Bacteroidetes bacterium]|nr:MAG: response regulator [Bacteroidota bacterium]